MVVRATCREWNGGAGKAEKLEWMNKGKESGGGGGALRQLRGVKHEQARSWELHIMQPVGIWGSWQVQRVNHAWRLGFR